jgi:hypothetical protein
LTGIREITSIYLPVYSRQLHFHKYSKFANVDRRH